ncbi:MAG TPA: flagellar hook capping FlgD N-terminal domain-containing protein [Acidobacteriota bacterium]|nr:flagellar hook capping FlgD N-terminal domain-containing protein [Acidobacteriota bacterium]
MEVGFNPILGNSDPTASFGNQQLGRFEFLRLLVAQIANQDPLEPVANTEFVSQVAQFSSLDELVKIRQLGEINQAIFEQLLAGAQEPDAPAEPDAPQDPGATDSGGAADDGESS